MRLAFLLGAVTISGGNNVVIEHAEYARAHGHDVTLITLRRWKASDLSWHRRLENLEVIHIDDSQHRRFDLAVATWWPTAIQLGRIDALQYAYFVQSIESRFFPRDQTRRRDLVDRTYALGLPGMTEANWIRRYLQESHGSQYRVVPNGIRKESFTPEGFRWAERERGRLRILVEGPFGVPIKNTARTVRVVRRARPHELWLLSSSRMNRYPGVSRVFSGIPVDDVAAVYRSCDLVVKLSYVEGMFGPPLEMFHCGGTALVYDVTGADEYIRDGVNAVVVPRDDEEGVTKRLSELMQDPDRLEALKRGAADTASSWPDWSESSTSFLEGAEEIVAGEPYGRDRLLNESAAINDEYGDLLGEVMSSPVGSLSSADSPWRERTTELIAYGRRQVRYRVEAHRRFRVQDW